MFGLEQLNIYFNKHLLIKQLSHDVKCNMGNIFRVSHILLLLHSSRGSQNKLKNMRNLENISHAALGTVR